VGEKGRHREKRRSAEPKYIIGAFSEEGFALVKEWSHGGLVEGDKGGKTITNKKKGRVKQRSCILRKIGEQRGSEEPGVPLSSGLLKIVLQYTENIQTRKRGCRETERQG